MKKSVKIAFCGIMAAIITVLMAASLIPNATYAAPAVAGLFIIPVFIEAGTGWALACYLVSAALSFYGDKTSWVFYIALFGYYPIVKPYIEKIKNPVLKWLLKFLVFDTAAGLCYAVEVLAFGFTVETWVLITLAVLGNAAFVLYDIAVSRMAALYCMRLHKRISSILKK